MTQLIVFIIILFNCSKDRIDYVYLNVEKQTLSDRQFSNIFFFLDCNKTVN